MPSKDSFAQQLVSDAQATISAAGTKSAEVNLCGTTLVGMYIPASFQGTSVSFEAAKGTGGTFVPVKDGAGNSVTKTVAASQFIKLDPADFVGINFLKIVSNATEDAQRVIDLAARPL